MQSDSPRYPFVRETPLILESPPESACTPVRARLAELASLSPGWDDGEGVALSAAGLQRLAQAFEAHFPEQLEGTPLPVPYLYPMHNGDVLAEWTIDPWAVSLQIALPNLPTQYCALNMVDGSEATHLLLLAPTEPHDWDRLVNYLVELVRARQVGEPLAE